MAASPQGVIADLIRNLLKQGWAAMGHSLSHHHFLHHDILAIDEAEHIDACGLVDVDVGIAADGLAAEHTAHHVDDLQGGVATIVDNPFAAVEEGEGLIGIVFFDAGGVEHQAEAAFVVVGVGLEGVARVGQQVDVDAGLVVDEVEVSHFGVAHFNADGVNAVFGGAEVDRLLTFAGATHHGEVLVVLGEINLGIVGVELELRQLAALVETNDGTVDDQALRLADVEVDNTFFVIHDRNSRKRAASNYMGVTKEAEMLDRISGLNEDSLHGVKDNLIRDNTCDEVVTG